MEFDPERFFNLCGNFGVILLAAGLLDELLAKGSVLESAILMIAGVALIAIASLRKKS